MSWRARRRIGSLAAAALLAAGCDSDGGPAGTGSAEGAAGAESVSTNASLSPEAAARLRARAIAALGTVLPAAATAAYANVRSGLEGAICGEVDAGDALGRRPFVVTPSGAVMLSTTSELRLEDPNDPFPDLYMQYCASPEELVRLGERMEGMPPPATIPNPALDEVPVPVDDNEGAEIGDAPPPAPNEPNQRRPADDSFFNSLLRTPRQSTPPG